MNVQILFFSWFRQSTGTDAWQVHLPESSRLSDLQSQVFEQFPDLRKSSGVARMALNEEYRSDDPVLKEGDVVAFFPPVQGG